MNNKKMQHDVHAMLVVVLEASSPVVVHSYVKYYIMMLFSREVLLRLI